MDDLKIIKIIEDKFLLLKDEVVNLHSEMKDGFKQTHIKQDKTNGRISRH